jgi:succinate-semialdehyde dehydrogenase/glutarate-semialdehyde dehydrogenase
MAGLQVGRGTQEGVQVGPVITEKARADILELVTDATDRGARLVTGGEAIEGSGFFMAPTVLTDVPDDCRICSEEVFGPVAPVFSFSSEQQVLARANDTEYGLIAYVFTQDLARALRVSEALDVGMVGLNAGVISNPAAPFGGVKQSGFGREGGREGIEEYLSTKYVGIGGL